MWAPPPPPDWLVEWTKYLGTAVGVIASILALFSGRDLLRAKAEEIRWRIADEG